MTDEDEPPPEDRDDEERGLDEDQGDLDPRPYPLAKSDLENLNDLLKLAAERIINPLVRGNEREAEMEHQARVEQMRHDAEKTAREGEREERRSVRDHAARLRAMSIGGVLSGGVLVLAGVYVFRGQAGEAKELIMLMVTIGALYLWGRPKKPKREDEE